MRNWLTLGLPLAVVLGGVIAYQTDVLPEQSVGALLAVLCVALPAPYAGWRVAQVAKSKQSRVILIASGVTLAALCAVPVYIALFPGDARYQGNIGNGTKTLSLGAIASGAYVLTVEGLLPERDGDVTAEYRLKLKSGDAQKSFDGEIWRHFGQVRVGRRGTGVQERARTYDRHRVSLAEGTAEFELAKLTTIDTLHLSLHKTLIPQWALFIAGALLFGIGTIVEARHGTEQVRALVSTMFSFAIAFALIFPDQYAVATPIRPVIGSGIAGMFAAIVIGGTSAWATRKWLRPAPHTK